jgi:hypothetical protein
MSRVHYGQRGYSGFSRSERAVEAEAEGKLPLSRAVPEVARQAGVSRKAARLMLNDIGPCEWHHTSKYANATDFYDVDEAVARFDPLYEDEEVTCTTETFGLGWFDLGIAPEHRGQKFSFDYEANSDLRKLSQELCPEYQFLRAVYAEHIAESIQRAASFRRWEYALRRLVK